MCFSSIIRIHQVFTFICDSLILFLRLHKWRVGDLGLRTTTTISSACTSLGRPVQTQIETNLWQHSNPNRQHRMRRRQRDTDHSVFPPNTEGNEEQCSVISDKLPPPWDWLLNGRLSGLISINVWWTLQNQRHTALRCINTHAVWHDNKRLKKQRRYYLPSCPPGIMFLDSDMSQRLEYVHYCFKNPNTMERDWITKMRLGRDEWSTVCRMNHEVHFRLL